MIEEITLFQAINTLLTTLFLLHLTSFFQWTYKLRHIGGPMPIPIFGNMLMKSAFETTKFIRKMRCKYGKTFVFWPGANNPMIVILEPGHVRQVLTDVHLWEKGYSKKVSVFFGFGLITTEGSKHKKDRKMFHRFFVRQNIESYLPMMNFHVRRILSERLENLSSTERSNINLEDTILTVTTDIFTQFAISMDLGETQYGRYFCENLKHFVHLGNNMVGESISTGLPLHPWLNPKRRKFDKLMDGVETYFKDIIAKRNDLRANTPELEPDDILKVMLDQKLSFRDMRDHLATMLGAGMDTTGWLMLYTIYMYSKHPEIQQKVKAEIKQVLGNRDEVTAEDLKQLKYLNMTLKETMRYYAIIPFLTRTALKDTTLKAKCGDRKIEDVFVPKGAEVCILLSLMHRDDDQWVDPGKYIPERFENVGDQSIQRGYIPFSYGMRSCIGNSFAIIKATVTLVHLFKNYSVEPVVGWKPKPGLGISQYSTNGIRVNLIKD